MTKNNETRGRPELPDNERRSVVVQFRCTEKEKEKLVRAAKRANEKLSDWLRGRAIDGVSCAEHKGGDS